MNKIITIIVVIIIGAGFSLQLKADNTTTAASGGEFVKVGAAGAEFLKIGVGARANGMAGAYGAFGNDLSSIFWNPAGIADIKAISADFSYTKWLGGFNHDFAAASLPIGDNFCFGMSFINFSSNQIEITTDSKAEGTGTYYSTNDLCFGLSFGGYLTEQFSFGVTAKYIQNAFSTVSSNGIAFDIGTMYQTGIQDIKLGFSIHNLGTQQTYTGQDLNATMQIYNSLYASPRDVSVTASSYSIPLIFDAGASSEVYKDEMNSLNAAIDFTAFSDTKEQFAIGGEYVWNDLVAIRSGYRFGSDEFGYSGGFGLKYLGGGFGGQIDYSLSPTKDFGIISRISINIVLK